VCGSRGLRDTCDISPRLLVPDRRRLFVFTLGNGADVAGLARVDTWWPRPCRMLCAVLFTELSPRWFAAGRPAGAPVMLTRLARVRDREGGYTPGREFLVSAGRPAPVLVLAGARVGGDAGHQPGGVPGLRVQQLESGPTAGRGFFQPAAGLPLDGGPDSCAPGLGVIALQRPIPLSLIRARALEKIGKSG